MFYKNNQLFFSPSDLIQFMDSPYASWMRRYNLELPQDAILADESDALSELLQDQGDQHERQQLAEFQKKYAVADISKFSRHEQYQATLEAMKSGIEIIFQGYVQLDNFMGSTDFLVKVKGSSTLGAYHYEVWDTKLAKSVKPYYVVQLCCYTEMLEVIQGIRPNNMVVVLGNQEISKLQIKDYYYYYQNLKSQFLDLQANFNPDQQPDPANYSSWGAWSEHAQQILLDRDHLSQVANITRSQIKRLEQANIVTMQALIDCQQTTVKKINPDIFQRLQAQAKIQRLSEGKYKPEFEILPSIPDQRLGFKLLPPESPYDVFFDIEGYPLVEGGLEYLWGNTYYDQDGKRQFIDFWAHDSAQEKQTFQNFIQWVYQRWQQNPEMHIYHYASYEITACRKLMGRYGVCELEVDELLRNEVFVDCYKIVRQGLRVGEPRYSIKNIEHLYRDKRTTEVGDGADSIVVYGRWRENPDGQDWQQSKILNDIRDYNIDDCNSTQELVDWLRVQQQQANITYQAKPEPEKTPSNTPPEHIILQDQLLQKAEALMADNPEQANIYETMAWLLQFHWREKKPGWWLFFERLSMSSDELLDDMDCLAQCKRTATNPFKSTPKARNWCYEYQYDIAQDFRNTMSSSARLLGEENITVTIYDINVEKGLVTIKCNEPQADEITLIPFDTIDISKLQAAITQCATNFYQDPDQQSAILDFLYRRPPRIKGHTEQNLLSSDSTVSRLTKISQLISSMDNSYISIQGPPGAGKTYTGKHVIVDLLKQNKKIGITSNSHKAINNLLLGVSEILHQQKLTIPMYKAENTYDDELDQYNNITHIDNSSIIESITTTPYLVGATTWGFCREELTDQFDYLFVDEAGQVSIANLVAMSHCSKNLVLMGDQMQLSQPIQGTHPGDSGLSVLDYLLGDMSTIPPDLGIFLDCTYRMHPDVNQFISEAIYDGRLHADADNSHQCIKLPKQCQIINQETGLCYIPVEHQGNTQASMEEVKQIQAIVQNLLGRIFFDKHNKQQKLGYSDILVVAPYNHQVDELKKALNENARVGTVDKFQGQEAPVVILSMCASDANEIPRGLGFLFERNRINVAISRAQALAIVVASPALINANVSGLSDMKLLNLYCWLINKKRFDEIWHNITKSTRCKSNEKYYTKSCHKNSSDRSLSTNQKTGEPSKMIKTVKQACTFNPVIQDYRMSQGIENLVDLINDEGDGQAFFSRNFITNGMEQLFNEGMLRLAGKSDQAVFELTQAMGGGKTHMMIALGLLARHAHLRPSVLSSDLNNRLDFGNARIAAFNGRNNPDNYIWGAIATQLGAEEEIKPYWINGPKAVDQNKWKEIISDTPTLILIDELPPYLDNASTQVFGQGTLASMVVYSLSALMAAALELPNCCIVIANLSGSYKTQTKALTESISNLQQETRRQAMTITPVQLAGNEIYEILKKRLIDKLPTENIINDIAEEYAGQIKKAEDGGYIIAVSIEQLAEQVRETYPFHPSFKHLVALFKENEGFRQTRGLMQFTARLLKSVDQQASDDVFLIGAQHLDLNDEQVKDEIGRIAPNLVPAITRDIADKGNAIAEILDAEIDSDAGKQVMTLLLASSLSRAVGGRIGLSESEIIEYLAAPNRKADEFLDILQKLREQAWYLHREEQRLFIKETENLSRQIERNAKEIPQAKIDQALINRLTGILQPAHRIAYQNVEILPRMDEIKLIGPRILIVIKPDGKVPPSELTNFFVFQQEKNNLFVLTGQDSILADAVEYRLRELYAIEQISNRLKQGDTLYEEARDRLEDAEGRFSKALSAAYNSIYFPGLDDIDGSETLLKVTIDNGLKVGEGDQSAEVQIENLLASPRANYKLIIDLKEKFTEYFAMAEAELWPSGKDNRRTPWKDVVSRAKCNPIWPWMPGNNGMETLRTEALKQGRWRLGEDGYIEKGPFPKEKTSINISVLSTSDTGETILNLTPRNAGESPIIYYSTQTDILDSDPQVDDLENFTTKDATLYFSVKDPSGKYEAGAATRWIAELKIRHDVEPLADKRKITLQCTPHAKIFYTLDGSNPKDGTEYKDPFEVGLDAVRLLVWATAGEANKRADFQIPHSSDKSVQIDESKPAHLNSGKRVTLDKTDRVYAIINHFREQISTQFKGVRIEIGAGENTVTVRFQERKITAEMIEGTVDSLRKILQEDDAPLAITITDGIEFENGFEAKEFAKLAGIQLSPGDIVQEE